MPDICADEPEACVPERRVFGDGEGSAPTTIYTRLTQHELEQIVSVFDNHGNGVLVPSPGD